MYGSVSYTTLVRSSQNQSGLSLADLREFIVQTADLDSDIRPGFTLDNMGRAVFVKIQEVTYVK